MKMWRKRFGSQLASVAVVAAVTAAVIAAVPSTAFAQSAPPKPSPPSPPVLQPPASAKGAALTALTSTGQVLNADGTPAANVDVWGTWSAQDGLRGVRNTRHAVTDQNGFYHLGMSFVPPDMSVSASRDGAAPAYRHAKHIEGYTYGVLPVLQFPAQEAALFVTVLDTDGKPAAGVSVEATAAEYEEDTFRFIGERFDYQDEEAKHILRALVPRVVTDSHGVARFMHLRPARYILAAAVVPPTAKTGDNNLSPFVLMLREHKFRAGVEEKGAPYALVKEVNLTASATEQEATRFMLRLSYP